LLIDSDRSEQIHYKHRRKAYPEFCAIAGGAAQIVIHNWGDWHKPSLLP
jgi:hypothetical protein